MSQTKEKKKTYRELIQEIIADLDKQYDRAGGLRDFAIGQEKEYFNLIRGTLSNLMSQLNKFDNNLPDDRANMKVGDWIDRLK